MDGERHECAGLHGQSCRDAEVDNLFGQVMAALDLSAGDPVASPARKRKQPAPDLPEIIDVPVHNAGHGLVISMLQAWHSHHKVSIKHTDTSSTAMLGEPSEQGTVRAPICTEQNVKDNKRASKA